MNYFKSFLMRYWYYGIMGILVILLITTSLLLYFSNEVSSQEDALALVGEVSNEAQEENLDIATELCSIDIKGAVKKPGVYQIECHKNINDALILAGGKTKSAYTDNINLSKSVSNEMVIYVYTTKEIKAKETTKSVSSEVKVETPTCENEKVYIDTCLKDNSSVIESNNGITKEEKNESLNDAENSTIKNTETKDNEIITDKNEAGNNVINSETKLISLNTATKEELMTLSGIGESKAEKIIAYREENNCFKSIEELKNVSGIGDSIFEKIKSNITV